MRKAAAAIALIVGLVFAGGIRPAAAAGDGVVATFGDAGFFGSTAGLSLSQPVVGMAATPAGDGYWEVARDGGIFAYGAASFLGSTGALRLAGPIVGMARSATGSGYWLVGSDGGVFTFGDATFLGSMGGVRLVRPVVGMVPSPTGRGYWMVAADGGLFTFGDAPFLGAAATYHPPADVVAMAATPTGRGYWMVAGDGAVFAFGDAGWFGNGPAGQEIVGMAADAVGDGYWLLGRDGTVFNLGGAGAYGSATPQIPAGEVALGMTATSTGRGYWVLAGEPPILAGGSAGSAVARLQVRLDVLGYWNGPATGVFNSLTTQALWALQKAANLPRTGVFDGATARALDAGSRPTPRTTAGYWFEVDKGHQLLMQVRDGHVERIFNTSTGTGRVYRAPSGARGVAVTPEGSFHIYNQINGLRVSDLGVLWRPKYFVGGYAIHGSPSIPPYPASHGCVRLSNGAINFLWDSNSLPLGTPVLVYS